MCHPVSSNHKSKHSHESVSSLVHLVESPHVPHNVCHRYDVVFCEEEQVEEEEDRGSGDKGQEVDVDPHAECLSNRGLVIHEDQNEIQSDTYC